MNIVVLAGGLSMERDVSLASGSLIANALRDAGEHAVLVDLYYGIEKEKMNFDGVSGRYEYKIPELAPDLDALIAGNGGRENPVGENVIEFCKMADVAFLALHGGVGENGIETRERVCKYLEPFGVKLDKEANNVRGKAKCISTDDSKVKIYVIPTNEELMIAKETYNIIK